MRWLWLLVALTLSSLAHADYYWEANGGKFADASSACSAEAAGAWGGVGAKVQAFKMAADGTSAECTVRYPNSTVDSTSTLYRQGTACTPPKTFNAATGACEAPPPPPNLCDAKAGQTASWGFQVPGYLTKGGHPLAEFGQIDGCQVDLGSFQCDAANDGSDMGYCAGTGTFTGQPGNNEPGLGGPETGVDHTQPPEPPEPPSTPENPDSCPEGMVPSGGGCVPKTPTEEPPPNDGCEFSLDPNCGKDDPDKPGDGTPDGCEFSLDPNCGKTPGTGDGDGSNPGTGDGGNGDGSGDGSGDGNGDGSSDGGDGSDDGKCDPKTDPKCADTGKEEPKECDPATDPDQCKPEESSVAGTACTAQLECKGDAIQCAILKEEKESRCQWDYTKAKPTIDAEIGKAEYQTKTDDHDMGGLFSSAIGASRWLPANCPAPLQKSLHSGGSITLSWQPTCDLASGLAPVIVGVASLFFAIYVGRGIGGGA